MASTIRTDKIGPADGSADFTLPTADGSAKSALITNGSKVLSFATGTPSASNFLRGDGTWAAAGGDNTPSWSAYNASTQSITANTETVVTLGSENWDTDSAFASNKFTVPAGEGGKYSISYGAKFNNINASNNVYMGLLINGTKNDYTVIGSADPDANHHYLTGNAILNLSAADYVEFMAFIYTNTDDIQYAHMSGFKLIGV